MFNIFLLICCLCCVQCILNPPSIAVVGGGIAGTSCAFFLRELFGDKTPITLYERDTIGGRLSLLNVDGKYYEAGGAVIHPRNQYMLKFLKSLGLKSRTPCGGNFGVYDGERFVFRESDWHFVTIADFLWRYGFSALELRRDVKSMLDDFSKIYDIQKQEYAFTNLHGLLDVMSPSFKNMTQETLLSHLTKKNYSKLLLQELVQAVMMVNYGQTNNISAFAGFVSLAGADNDLFSVEGGNQLIPEALLQKSGASVVTGDVQDITLLPDQTFSLKYLESSGTETNNITNTHDIVLLAAPFVKNRKNVRFLNFNKDFGQFERPYHRTVSTFVKGELNPSAFNCPDTPDEILTFEQELLFNSIGKACSVHDDDRKDTVDVFKVFSQIPLSEKSIDGLFENVEMVRVKDWLAYPHYEPPETLPPFFLYPGLYYANGIELAASAMEMSAIAAKNVALLAFNLWHNLIDKVDHHKRTYKDEL